MAPLSLSAAATAPQAAPQGAGDSRGTSASVGRPAQISGTTWAADCTTLRTSLGWDSDNHKVCNTVYKRNGKGD